ncbi:MAG: glycosyltransferase [Chloroflexi bacterium]|nr:glycosyltransferase [Chloroflexota bacterium]
MLISVVVPAINEQNYIRASLDSLRSQELHNLEMEIIVVDGRSTDRTREIAREYGARVIVQPQRGVAQARQIGFEAARGQVIASTDADSIVPPDWLERLVSELQKESGVVGVYGPIRLYDGKVYEDLFSYYVAGTYLWVNAAINRPAFSGQNFAVWRAAWERVGGFDTDWVSAEDINLSLKMARAGRVKFCWDIPVYTSSRRTREGYKRVFAHSISNYLRVTWLKMPPLPFKDIR